MRIYVPLTFRHEATWSALDGWEVRAEQMDGDAGYLRFMEERWADGRSFIVCEHDVVPSAEQIWQLIVCPETWCCFNEYDGGPPTLSLARFRRVFLQTNACVWDGLREMYSSPGGHQPLWTLLDAWLVEHADRAPHIHQRPHIRNDRPGGSLH